LEGDQSVAAAALAEAESVEVVLEAAVLAEAESVEAALAAVV
jgi:hypothetical protein